VNLIATLRDIRAYRFGRRDGRAFARKHASLAYLTAPPFPKELSERYRVAMETDLHRYERRRGNLEHRLQQVRQQRQGLEKAIGQDPVTPEVFAHWQARVGRNVFLVAVFGAELLYNKLAMDTLGIDQLESIAVASIATIAMFWLGHEAGNQYRKTRNPLTLLWLIPPALLAIMLALLRADYSHIIAQIDQLPLPSPWLLNFSLILLGLVLVALTFWLGYKAPHERE
jgi:hypothetical protein